MNRRTPQLEIVSDETTSRIDIQSLRETLRYIHDDLASERRLERVRLGLAIALVEIERAEDHRRSRRFDVVQSARFVPGRK